MPPMRRPSTIVEAINSFFAEHEVASLRLPSGWFGRPRDNMHQLSEVAIDGDYVLVILDGKQVLTLDAEGASADARVLYVKICGGRWAWTEYGRDQEHSETGAWERGVPRLLSRLRHGSLIGMSARVARNPDAPASVAQRGIATGLRCRQRLQRWIQ